MPTNPRQGKATKTALQPTQVTEETPCFRNIFVENVVCQGAKRAVYFNGLPEMPLDNLRMKNSLFTAERGAEMHYAKNITFENVRISCSKGDRITMTDVTGFTEK